MYILTELNYKTVQELKIRSEAHLTLGHIEEKNGFGSSAMNNYRQSIKDNPANMEAMLAYGVILSQSGQLDEAEKYLIKCNEVIPGSALIHNNLSAIYIRMNKDNLAIKHLSELIRLQPENFQAYYNLGMLFLRAEKSKQAIQYLQIALTIKPDYANAHIGLAKALNIEGQKSQADFHKQKAEELKLIAQHKTKHMKTLNIIIVLLTGWIFFNSNKQANNDEWVAPVSYDTLTNPLSNNAKAITEGKKIYDSTCWSCHGYPGKWHDPES